MPGRGRGRGRGGRGGHGRSRGRGGRRVYGMRNNSGANADGASNDDQARVISIEHNPKEYFTGTANAQQHYEAQVKDCGRYCAAFVALIKNGIKPSQNSKIRALAVALGRNDLNLVTALLNTRSQFGLVEVLKAITLLDAGRQARTLERRLKSLELSSAKVNPQKLSKLKVEINNLNKMKLPVGSASGAVCKHIIRWVRTFSPEDLEFYAIHFPKEPWQKLTDICHFSPKDFPAAPWFLPHCFGNDDSLPENSLVKACLNLSAENVNEVVKSFAVPFSVVKKFKSDLNAESKKKIALYESKLDTVLWYFEDLQCDGVERVIYDRLSCGEPVTLSNGKLLERLLTILLRLSNEDKDYIDKLDYVDDFFTRLIEIADPKLTSIRLPLESPVAILGDASPSMNVAIRTSTIIASLLTSICSAKLVFFDNTNRDAPFLPKTVKEMLKLALITKTNGSTIPAVSLYPFYKRKEIIKTFIVVTDEEENGSHENYGFAPLFKKYHDEVYPATLVFVSFLRSQHQTGQMVRDLHREGIYPKQLQLNGDRPDLSRLDDLFGQLSATTTSFQDQLAVAEREYTDKGVMKLFEGIKGSNQFDAENED